MRPHKHTRYMFDDNCARITCCPQTTQVSREVERTRLEAVELREDRARVESELKDIARENRMLQDRLSDGNLRSRVRERDR